MATSLLGQLSELATPQVLDQVSKMTGVDTSLLSKGLGAAGAVSLGSMAKSAGTNDGLSSLMGMLDQANAAADAAGASGSSSAGGMLGSLLGGGGDTNPLIGNLMNSVLGGGGSDVTDQIMGGGINAISGTLSKAIGFNVAPMLKMVAPVLLGMVAKGAKSGGLDADGVKNMLTTQAKEFADDPANAETTKLVTSALDAGRQGAAIRDTYTDAGWSAIKGVPLAAMAMVVAASPSSGGGAAAEFSAAAGAISQAADKANPASLLNIAFGGGPSQDEIDAVVAKAGTVDPLAVIKTGVDQVSQGNPGEVAAYKSLIRNTAQATAEATKEGGFLGMGGTQVSAEEQVVLDRISAALA